jgi:hypothetical protein
MYVLVGDPRLATVPTLVLEIAEQALQSHPSRSTRRVL